MSELPESWKHVDIERISEIVSGGTPSSTISEYYTEDHMKGIAWVTPADLSGYKRKYISHGNRSITEQGYKSCSAKLMPSGSVLFSSRAPIGYVAIAENEISTNQGFKSFVPDDGIESGYLYYYFKSIKHLAESLATGTTFKELSGKVAKTLPFPLAPQAEQTRIVEKLDEVLAQVDTIKARLDSIPTILKRFRQSVLAAAVSGRLTEEWRKTNPTTDISSLLVSIKNERDSLKKKGLLKKSFGKHEPVDGLNIELPESWIWTCFDEIAANDDNALKAGPFGSSLKKADCTDSGYRVYGQEQVIAGNEKLVSYYIDEIKFEQLKSCAIKPRDILISLVGTIGKVLILSEKVEAGIINPRLVKLSLNEEIERSFIKTYLDSPIAWQFFKGFSHGGTMDILNLGILKQLPIALPPVEEQKEIVRIVDQYFAFADTIEAQVKKAQARVDNLTQSILAKAFRGELVAQDPSDEPAEKLLERIAQARKEAEALAKVTKKVAKTK